MVDTPKTPEEFDDLSDEDFMKLDENQFSGDVPEGETSLTSEELNAQTQKPDENDPNEENTEGVDPNQSSADDPDADGAGNGDDPDASEGAAEEGNDPENQGGSGIDPMAEAAAEKTSESGEETPTGKQPEANAQEKGKTPDPDKAAGDGEPVKGEKFKLPKGVTGEQVTAALAFQQAIQAPIKADGKEITIRSAEDAIRFIQQGVNYSRRMQEMKPMKAMNRMLTDHGLNDPGKLSYLIDLAKGDKTAITKLLKDNNLDPMDLDVSAETGYQAKSYAGNPQDNAFRDALDNVTAIPEGQALVADIHSHWDDASKAKLHADPSILGNLLELRQSGVYQQVTDELTYQRSMGYLTETPFLQAFDQVGEAMKRAGVLNVKTQPAPTAKPLGQLQSNTQNTGQPVASGARKAASPKKEQPNPHLSSTPPTKQANVQEDKQPDFGSMTDEDFMKMPPPE